MNKNVHFRQFYIDSQSGHVYNSDITMTTDDNNEIAEWELYSNFEAAYIGQIPKPDAYLRDINRFWDSQGIFMLDQPKKLTITQGDGQKTDITLYKTDTIDDVRKKLNDAIAYDLGQLKYTDANNFVSYVKEGKAANYGDEAVEGTMLIRSAIPGKLGELNFSGDEDLLNALGFNTIQSSEEVSYTASTYDAYTNRAIVTNVKSTASEFKGLIPPEIDVEVPSTAGLFVSWNEKTKHYVISSNKGYTATLHLKDNNNVSNWRK